MKLSQALKLKNQLIRELNKFKIRVTSNNSVDEGNEPAYNSAEEWKKYQAKSIELNELKIKISAATQRILPHIFAQGEFKNQVAVLKTLNVADGVEHQRYGQGSPIKKKATIKEADRDSIVAELEKKIDELQDQIDAYNAATDI